MRISWDMVSKWTKSSQQNFAADGRGWQKGRRRKWTKATEKKVREIFKELNSDNSQFYVGPTAIHQTWRKKHPQLPAPPLRTIGRILADLHLSSKRRQDRHKDASRYLCYPEYTIYTAWGGRVAEADFIGHKFIAGQTEPLNFIAFCFKKEPKLRYFQRISDQTAKTFIKQCQKFFQSHEKPDYLKVDNCLATIGSASGKHNLSKTMLFLLKNRVAPIFSVPRKPFSQASIEGNNSVFSRKFWNKERFSSPAHVDNRLETFNRCSCWYTNYQPPAQKAEPPKQFIPRIFFIRQVKEDQEIGKAYIEILNDRVIVRKAFINYFILAEWNLKEEQLYIYFEKEQISTLIRKQSFKINQRSKESLVSFGQ